MNDASSPLVADAFIDRNVAGVPHAASGRLHGLSFAVKDIFDVAGRVTGCGNPQKLAEGKPAAHHASAVARLLDAGAAFVGKTHTAELAFSLDGRNEHYGTPPNPAAAGRVPGGSSSGSASAVASGLVDFALGSDTSGSIRGPASFCGLAGLRATHGRIAIDGVMPLAQSFDTVGWFARTYDIYERVGEVLLGADDEGPPLTRLLLADDAFALLDDRTKAAFAAPLAAIAHRWGPLNRVNISQDALPAWRDTHRTLQGFEAWRNHGEWITRRRPSLNPAVGERFAAGGRVTAAAYEAALRNREEIRARVCDVLGGDGVVVMPTMPGIAPRLDADEDEFERFRATALMLTCISSESGCPQLTLPLAELDGCPLGLSLLAPAGRDRALLALGRQVLELSRVSQ
ncbi:MAG TPA: amidase [Bauldia sp.]|nr:amidase [Bauldia sp.]